MKLGRTTKIRQNFLCLWLIDHSRYPFFISSWFNPRIYPYPRSQLFFLHSPIDHTRSNPSFLSSFLRVLAYTYASSFIILVPLHQSSTSFCCSDIVSMSTTRSPRVGHLIVLRSWPSWVCRVSSAHGGCDVYPTLASSILFWVCHVSDARGGCNVYHVLAFLFYCRVFHPGKVQCSDLLRCCVCATLRARHQFLSIGYRLCLCLCLCLCLHGFAIVSNSSSEPRGVLGSLPLLSPLFV